MPSYIQVIGSWILAHGGKIVYAANVALLAMTAQGWKPNLYELGAWAFVNALAGYNAAIIQPKLAARKLKETARPVS